MKALTAAPEKLIRVWDKDWCLIGILDPDDVNEDGSIALDHHIAKWILDQQMPEAPDFRPVAHCTIDEHGERWFGTLVEWEALKAANGDRRFRPTWSRLAA